MTENMKRVACITSAIFLFAAVTGCLTCPNDPCCKDEEDFGASITIETIEGEIDVLSWSWEASSDPGTGKVNVQDLSFTKYVDKASPDLMLNCCNGKHIDKAVLVVRKAGEQPLDYLTITMQDLIIDSVSFTGREDDRPTEKVILRFATIDMTWGN